MTAVADLVPARHGGLVIRPIGNRGQHVVKDLKTGHYYTLGEQESFLLTQLDGRRAAGTVCRAFAERFGEPLAEKELDDFVQLARNRGFLERSDRAAKEPAEAPSPS